jgi:hypothetical protein
LRRPRGRRAIIAAKEESMIRIALALILTSLSFGAFAQMSWSSIEKQLREHWKKTYPTEKILKIEKKGEVQYYATERQTETVNYWGWIWETRMIERQGAFARQVADVTVERANKTQVRFEVAAVFEKQGNAWISKGVGVRDSKDLTAAKAGDLPSNAQAAALFTEAWKKHRPDFAVEKVEVLKSEPKQSGDRRWITYKLAITATGTDKGSQSMYQKKYRCTPEDYSSVLKLEGGNWVPDDKMIKNVNESRDCSLAK